MRGMLESAATVMKELQISIGTLDFQAQTSLHVHRLAGVSPGVCATMPTGIIVHGGGAMTYSSDGSRVVSNGLPLHFEAVAVSKSSSERVLSKLNWSEPSPVDCFVRSAHYYYYMIRNLRRKFAAVRNRAPKVLVIECALIQK